MNAFPMAEAEKRLGYTFSDKALLKTAFTHSTYANSYGGEDNERLEYLGDAVLQLVVSEMLFFGEAENGAALKEGEMTKGRQRLVSKEPLEKAVKKLGVLPYLMYVGEGANNVGKKAVSSLFESIVAAIYLDGDGTKGRGYENAKAFIQRNVDLSADCNFKGKLQEYLQKTGEELPHYTLIEKTGCDNAPTFEIEVLAAGKTARGIGLKKAQAEAEAAKKWLKTFAK